MLTQLYPDHPSRVLVMAAHPDDIDFIISGTIAHWIRGGAEVHFVLATRGEVGSHDLELPPTKLAPIREAEQRTAAQLLGVKSVEFLGYPDGALQPTLELRRDFVKAIRKYKPTAVVMQDPARRYNENSYVNHPDHIACGEAALAATMPGCDSPFIFPELLADGYEPYKVYEIYLYMVTEPNIWVDITDSIDQKIATIQCHQSQIKGWTTLPEDIKTSAARVGEPHNLKYAEQFRYLKLE